ncbi:MAG: tetratricopeptide repeat protein [Pyrinomonadaceae bacterium]
MKGLISLLHIMLFGVVLCFAVTSVKSVESSKSNAFVNRIDGIVWDPYRHPVPDVYVELQNELGSSLSRIRTDSTGRFSFTVANQGNYIVSVLASGTDYSDTSEAVEINTGVSPYASDSAYLDIYLKFDKRKVNAGITGITEAIFVQEIPDQAQKLYKIGVKDISSNKDKGFDEIEQALKIFPNYYDALNTLGRAYVQRKEYQKSLEYLIKSIDINQRSFSSFYALAYACYQLNHRPEASEAARAATIIQPSSVNAQLLYGTVLRLDGSYEKAEKALLRAESLSKNTPVAEIHMQLALLYNKLGRNKEAADELELYLKIQPNAANKKELEDTIVKLRKEPSK